MRKKILSITQTTFIVLAFLISGAVAQKTIPRSTAELSAKQIAKNALPAVVLLVCDDPNTEGYTQGSGFFIKPGILVTNYHVIKGNTRGAVKVAYGTNREKRTFRIARVIAFDEEADLALLSIPAARLASVPYLSLAADNKTVEVGENVYALGNPEGLVGTISPGIISANQRSSAKKARLQISAPISHGSSGGPIVNGQGRVVGVAVGSLSEGQNLNFAVPAALIYYLLGKAKLPNIGEDSSDTAMDKGAKSVANWEWTTTQITDAGKKTPVVSIIGPVRAGESDDVASLRKLAGVYVLIEDLSDAGKQILNKEQLQIDIELRLRRNGIRVFTSAEQVRAPGQPMLYVNIGVLESDDVYSYHYRIGMEQQIRLDRDPSFTMSTETWHTGSTGYAGARVASTGIRGYVLDGIDKFCNDFLKANTP